MGVKMVGASVRRMEDPRLLRGEAAFVEGRDDEIRGIHLTGRRAGEAAERAGARRLVLTHVPAWNDPEGSCSPLHRKLCP